MTTTRREFQSIQYLRGLAVSMVVLYHLGVPLKRFGMPIEWPEGLAAGVDVFFVISGFVMWATTSGRDVTTTTFWAKRLLRIVPLYWLMTLAMTAVLFVAPTVFNTSRFDAQHVLASLLFVPWMHPIKHTLEPVVMPGWTLNYEIFFYFLFGLVLFLPQRSRLPMLVTGFGVLVALGLMLPSLPAAAEFYLSPVILEFLLGVILAELLLTGRLFALAPAVAITVMLAALAAILLADHVSMVSRTLFWGIPAAIMVAAGLGWEQGGRLGHWPVLRLVGDASYSIYLSQLVSMAVISAIWGKLVHASGPWVTAAFAVVDLTGALLGGIACYLLIEKPLQKAIRFRRGTRAQAI